MTTDGMPALPGKTSAAYSAAQKPFVGDLTPAQLKACRAVIRCEHDDTVVAAVSPGWVLITRLGRRRMPDLEQATRSSDGSYATAPEHEAVTPCGKCPLDARELAATGRQVRRAERSLDMLQVRVLAESGKTKIRLIDVLTVRSPDS